MNSTEFYIKAGEAICEWSKTHNGACFLTLEDGAVVCHEAKGPEVSWDKTLHISIFEVSHGMKSERWQSIGTALHNLYCKELACHEHQKH